MKPLKKTFSIALVQLLICVFGPAKQVNADDLNLAYVFQYPVADPLWNGVRGWYIGQDFQDPRPDAPPPRLSHLVGQHLGEDWGFTDVDPETGDEIEGSAGRPVVAVADGYVEATGVRSGLSGFVILKHHLPSGSYVLSVHIHMSPAHLPAEGSFIPRNGLVGALANHQEMAVTGFGPHLHFEIRGTSAQTGIADNEPSDGYAPNPPGYYDPTLVPYDGDNAGFIEPRSIDVRLSAPVEIRPDAEIRVRLRNYSATDFVGSVAASLYSRDGTYVETLDDVPNDPNLGEGGSGLGQVVVSGLGVTELTFHAPSFVPPEKGAGYQLRVNMLADGLDSTWWSVINPGNFVNPVHVWFGYCDDWAGCVVASPFRDVEMHSWYAHDVVSLVDLGIVKGRDANHYVPSGDVLRAEFIKMVMEALVSCGVQMVDGVVPYEEFYSGTWYLGYLRWAYGYVNPHNDEPVAIWSTDDIVAPDGWWGQPLERSEATRMVANGAQLEPFPSVCRKDTGPWAPICAVYTGEQYGAFGDVAWSSPDALWVYPVRRADIVSGQGDGSFQPTKVLNRAEAARVIALFIKALRRSNSCNG